MQSLNGVPFPVGGEMARSLQGVTTTMKHSSSVIFPHPSPPPLLPPIPSPSLSHLLSLLSYGNLPRFLLLSLTAVRLVAALVAVASAATLAFHLQDFGTLHERALALRNKVGDRGMGDRERDALLL